MIELKDVWQAKRQLISRIKPTSLLYSEYFSKFLGKSIYLKLENMQITGAFKVRGAYYKLLELSNEDSEKKVICVSAGNHAQGVAWAGQKLGFEVKVVMPKLTSLIKVASVRELGAEVLLFGETLEEAYQKASEISAQDHLTFIHPYNDELVIAGQGTIGLEIFGSLFKVGTVIVPVGGGGLIAGVSLALKEMAKEKRMRPAKIIGIRSQAKIAEGILVKKIGEIPQRLIDEYVDEMVEVREKEIASAILMLMEKTKLVVEGAGAVGIAALLAGKININNFPEPIVIILSGGNIDISSIGKIIKKYQK